MKSTRNLDELRDKANEAIMPDALKWATKLETAASATVDSGRIQAAHLLLYSAINAMIIEGGIYDPLRICKELAGMLDWLLLDTPHFGWGYGALLRHPHWQMKRAEILLRDDCTCQECGDDKGGLHVHHKQYISGRMPWEYASGMLVTLCDGCHAKHHKEGDDGQA